MPGEPDTYIGTFCELNAYADNHKPADPLYVSYKIKVNGDTFSGLAIAKQGTASHKAVLIGHARLKIDPSIIPSS
ncbi:MAG TPA: hypothetical protein VHE99_03870 [Gammaproteobacteria bacterium]|nr:hypothetical protein [Gammaproteobacteria bacterium]